MSIRINICKNGHLTYGNTDKCMVCGDPIIVNSDKDGTFNYALTGFVTMQAQDDDGELEVFEVMTVIPRYCEYDNFEVTEDMIVHAIVPIYRLYGTLKTEKKKLIERIFFNYMRLEQNLRIEYGCVEFWKIIEKIIEKLDEIFEDDRNLASEIAIIKEATDIYRELKEKGEIK